jgi:copper chaperone CopZ
MAEPIIKKRKIAFMGILDRLSKDKIKNNLEKGEGIIMVDVDSRGSLLNLQYDLRKINFATIERCIKGLGFGLSSKFMERFKRGMAKFTEQNEMDNLNAAPSSCCSDPKESCHKASG